MDRDTTKADVGFFASIGGWIVSHFTGLNDFLQLVALCVAIVSGICAAVYHIRAARKL